ncbi:MAG: DUF4936 family protein [Betaproteobacteria bacterium]|nr:DUF4936 family protein [Betaproteobacteria bacterium]
MRFQGRKAPPSYSRCSRHPRKGSTSISAARKVPCLNHAPSPTQCPGRVMASSYYIYYRVRQDCVDRTREVVRAMIGRIDTLTGVKGRCLRRAEEPLLWMEIYEDVPDETAFEQALAGAVQSCEFARLLQTGAARKAERFVSCA